MGATESSAAMNVAAATSDASIRFMPRLSYCKRIHVVQGECYDRYLHSCPEDAFDATPIVSEVAGGRGRRSDVTPIFRGRPPQSQDHQGQYLRAAAPQHALQSQRNGGDR